MRGHIAVAVVAIGLFSAGQVQAADTSWTGGEGNYGDPNYWSPSVPGAGDYATISNGGDNVSVTDTQEAYYIYLGATQPTSGDPNYVTSMYSQSSYNTLTVSGGGASLTVGKNIFLSASYEVGVGTPLISGDYNQLLVTDGATVSVAGQISSAYDASHTTTPGLNNKLTVQNGSTLNCDGYVDMSGGDMTIQGGSTVTVNGAGIAVSYGNLIINNGTINAPGGNVMVSQDTIGPPGQYNLLFQKGLINTTVLTANSSVMRIGDGAGASGEARTHVVAEIIGSDVDPNTAIDPNFPAGTKIVVMSDGIISGTADLSASSAKDLSSTMLVMSGGQIDPGPIDNSYSDSIYHRNGTLEFASGGILNIDLFGDDDYDTLDYDSDEAKLLKIDAGAILNVRFQDAYLPELGASWDILWWLPETRSGEFTTILGPAGYEFNMSYFEDDEDGIGTLTVTAVPEPATLTLLALGGAALALRRRRRQLR